MKFIWAILWPFIVGAMVLHAHLSAHNYLGHV